MNSATLRSIIEATPIKRAAKGSMLALTELIELAGGPGATEVSWYRLRWRVGGVIMLEVECRPAFYVVHLRYVPEGHASTVKCGTVYTTFDDAQIDELADALRVKFDEYEREHPEDA